MDAAEALVYLGLPCVTSSGKKRQGRIAADHALQMRSEWGHVQELQYLWHTENIPFISRV